MAKFDLKFLDYKKSAKSICVNQTTDFGNGIIRIDISNINSDQHLNIELDKSTAIKFAKTLRTEINKITESEVKNEK